MADGVNLQTMEDGDSHRTATAGGNPPTTTDGIKATVTMADGDNNHRTTMMDGDNRTITTVVA